MNFTHRILLVGLAIAMTASCAHVPRMPNQDQETANLRAKYLRDHPNGLHNDRILKGEVAKGMDVTEVLASWGVPERRIGKPSNKEEYWIYTARDEYSQNTMIYELIFVDRVLSRWIFDRGNSGSGVLRAVEGASSRPVSSPGEDAYGKNGRIPQK